FKPDRSCAALPRETYAREMGRLTVEPRHVVLTLTIRHDCGGITVGGADDIETGRRVENAAPCVAREAEKVPRRIVHRPRLMRLRVDEATLPEHLVDLGCGLPRHDQVL